MFGVILLISLFNAALVPFFFIVTYFLLATCIRKPRLPTNDFPLLQFCRNQNRRQRLNFSPSNCFFTGVFCWFFVIVFLFCLLFVWFWFCICLSFCAFAYKKFLNEVFTYFLVFFLFHNGKQWKKYGKSLRVSIVVEPYVGLATQVPQQVSKTLAWR